MSSRHRKAKRAKLQREQEVRRLTALLESYDAVIADLRSCGVADGDFVRVSIARSVLSVCLEEERRSLTAIVVPE